MSKAVEFRKVSLIKAKTEVSDFIVKKRRAGHETLNVLDVVLSLRIPAPQVEKVIEGFVKEKRVKEINGR
ncbi:MAG: hypothetical protein WC511_07480 [Candidatus Pacearchaeota archaeon]|jgi:hypothetical protein